MSGTDPWTVLTIVGLAMVTVLTRSFFFLSNRAWTLPGWARSGLRYAPVAALAAVVVPEIVTSHGQLIGDLRDARVFAALAGIGWYAWRRSVLGTIVAGTTVFLLLRLGLGW